jgi:glycosyltransferase involved in cell wall biosynthesis
MKRPFRIAALSSHPIQYAVPLYRRLASEPDLELTVLYCSLQGVDSYFEPSFGRTVAWDVPLLDGYAHKLLPNWSRSQTVAGPFSLINPAIAGELWSGRYDALWLHGYAYATNLIGWLAAGLGGLHLFYRCEASLRYDQLRPRHRVLLGLKRLAMRVLLGRMSACLAIGSLNREFYQAHGVADDRIFHVPYAVDNRFFFEQATRCRARRAALRAELSLGERTTVFLFAAKMTPAKEPLQLLDAYGALDQAQDIAMIFAGDGPLKAEAEKQARGRKLRNVIFPGFVNQTELPNWYSLSDVFIRPDGICPGDWGLTVNEAMASGLAVICSDQIGAGIDLVHPEINGFLVRHGDRQQLVAAMRRCVDDPLLVRRMGTESLRIIQDWDYEACVAGIRQEVDKVRAIQT